MVVMYPEMQRKGMVYMVRGLYTAATGMMVQRDRMDVLTNNLVQCGDNGFKKGYSDHLHV